MKDETTVHNIYDLNYIEDLEWQVQELKLLLREEQRYSRSLEIELRDIARDTRGY